MAEAGEGAVSEGLEGEYREREERLALLREDEERLGERGARGARGARGGGKGGGGRQTAISLNFFYIPLSFICYTSTGG